MFVRPKVEEVEAYCRERGNNINSQAFIDYYTANGWKVGRNAMKDWRAAVRTWERNERERGKTGLQSQFAAGMNQFLSRGES